MHNPNFENEGIRVLEELVCEATPGSSQASTKQGDEVLHIGENEGIRVLEEQVWDANCSNTLARTGAIVTLSLPEPQLRSALSSTETALRRLANYELDPSLARRLDSLSERKEFLNEEEHRELMALVEFAHHRNIEKLEAQLALKQLHEIVPELVSSP